MLQNTSEINETQVGLVQLNVVMTIEALLSVLTKDAEAQTSWRLSRG